MTHGMNTSRVCVHHPLSDSCAALVRLSHYVPQYGMNKAAREVARGLLCRFEAAVRDHCHDQESHLFPALRARSSAYAGREVKGLIDRLTAQHRAMERRWNELRSTLTRISLCRLTALSLADSKRFARLCCEHVATEDRIIFAMASEVPGYVACLKLVAYPEPTQATSKRRSDAFTARPACPPLLYVPLHPLDTTLPAPLRECRITADAVRLPKETQ